MTTALSSWELAEMRLFVERPLMGDPEGWPSVIQGWQIWDKASISIVALLHGRDH